MSIFDINFSLQARNQIPPSKRKPKILGYLIALVTPLQKLRDLFYDNYANGFNGAAWDVAAAYTKGEQIRYIDRSVYECIVDSAAGILPTNSLYWVKVQENYIGLNERLKYNSRKMVFEYVLNKWFEVPVSPSPQIYIKNNVILGTAFVMARSGELSSTMARNSVNQSSFLGNSYTFNQYAFTIFVPVAIYNALDPTAANRENIVRAIADKYTIAGMLYDVQTY